MGTIPFDLLKDRIEMLTVINDGFFKVSMFIRRNAKRIRCKQQKLTNCQKKQNDWMQGKINKNSDKKFHIIALLLNLSCQHYSKKMEKTLACVTKPMIVIFSIKHAMS